MAPQPLLCQGDAEGSAGSIGHLEMALFRELAGLARSNVSYKGDYQAMNDVVAGHVPVMFSILRDAVQALIQGQQLPVLRRRRSDSPA